MVTSLHEPACRPFRAVRTRPPNLAKVNAANSVLFDFGIFSSTAHASEAPMETERHPAHPEVGEGKPLAASAAS